MPEPVDPAEDLVLTRGIGGACQLRAYDPAADTNENADPWGDPVACFGFRTGKRVRQQGQQPNTTAIWTVTGPATRPTVGSLILDPDATGEAWVIDSVSPNPTDGTVFDCEATLQLG